MDMTTEGRLLQLEFVLMPWQMEMLRQEHERSGNKITTIKFARANIEVHGKPGLKEWKLVVERFVLNEDPKLVSLNTEHEMEQIETDHGTVYMIRKFLDLSVCTQCGKYIGEHRPYDQCPYRPSKHDCNCCDSCRSQCKTWYGR